jgi:hypothetical protein
VFDITRNQGLGKDITRLITDDRDADLFVLLRKEIILEEKKLKRKEFAPIIPQDSQKDIPCPVGKSIYQCEMIRHVILTIDDERSLKRYSLISHLVTWHRKEILDWIQKEITELMEMK